MKSYKLYQLQKGEWQQWLGMHLSILRLILFVQLAIIIIAMVISLYSFTQSSSLRSRNPSRTMQKLTLGNGFSRLLDHPAVKPVAHTFWGSFLLYPLLWPGIILVSKRRANRFRNKTIRGATLIEPQELQRLLPKAGDALPLTDEIHIPREFENRHFLILGATGTGKSNCISRIINEQKQRGVKALVYDRKDGEFLSRFYNPESDLIFNPFDKRSLYFNVLNGRQTDADFDALAANIIPSASGKEKFFHDTARDILSGIFRYCHLKNSIQNADIWSVLTLSAPELHRALRGINSDAAGYILNHNSGQTQGIISTLMQFAKIFKYLGNTQNRESFSPGRWLNDNTQAGFIFLTNTTKQREALKGILSLFINCLADTVLALQDNLERRIFFFLDEFGTLQKMDAVKDLITLTRSKGCAFILGLQDKSLLNAIYDKEISDTIVNNCNNYLIFRLNGYDNAKYMSDLLGQAEKDYSLALGSKDLSQEQAFRNLAKIDTLILPSQIQALPDLHCYLKLHGLPATKTQITYTHFPEIVPGFIPNEALLSPVSKRTAGASEAGGTGSALDQTEPIQLELNPDPRQEPTDIPPRQEPDKDFAVDDFDF